MNHIGKRKPWIIAFVSMMFLVLTACASSNEPPPIGAGPAGPNSYPVEVDRTTLSFLSQPEAQAHDGLEIQLTASPNVPQLYYRYQVTSKLTGTYIAFMPNPPTVYLAYRIPFYKNDPDKVVVKFLLTNNSTQVQDTAHAVCAFDLDGQTVVTQPLKTDDLLPGHVLAVPVEGPTLSELKGHKELVVWLYQMGSTQTEQKSAPLKWTLPYTLTTETEPGNAELIAQSPLESGVSQYEGKIVPAGTDADPASSGQ
ncbi:MAG: hypothetical protein ACRESU_02660 [Gammaproteobacteria bacterium]